MSKRSQRALREVVSRATTPTVTVPEIAKTANLTQATIRKFVQGYEVTADQEQRIKTAVLYLLPSEKS